MIGETVLRRASVCLRPVSEDDLPEFQRWLNDPEIYQWLAAGVLTPPTWKDELKWWRRQQSAEDEITWSIDGADERLLGNVTLHWVPSSKSATFGIFIGDKSEWNKGYGGDAVGALSAHCFNDLGINRIGLNCDATNARAIRCYSRAGFRHEGVMRENRHLNGEFRDSVVMGLLKREWSDA